MNLHRLRRPCMVALLTLLGLALTGGVLHSPIDILSGATPKSAPRQSTTLQGSYILHIHTTSAPFTTQETQEALRETITHSKAVATPLQGQAITLSIPNDDPALAAFAARWQTRLHEQGITLQIKTFDPVMVRSRLLAGKYSVVLGPADTFTLPDLPNNAATTIAGYEMR